MAIKGERERWLWLRSYSEEIAQTDLRALSAPSGRRKDSRLFANYLEACALNTAGVVPHSTIFRHAGVNERTASGYREAAGSLGIIAELPAWGKNRRNRLYVERAKRHMVDAGIAAAAAGLTLDDVYAEDDLRGRFIDTFVTTQLRVEAEAAENARLYHLRSANGDHEIDVVAEVGRGLIAFEFKAGIAPTRSDARHLMWFRDQIAEDRFKGGVVFHTGPHRYELDRDIEAVPIAGLWGQTRRNS